MLQPRLLAHNAAIRDLSAMKTYMESLSIVLKRSQERKTLCVSTVERCFLDTITAWTGVPELRAKPKVENDKRD